MTYGFIHADTPHLLANIGGQAIFAILICLDIQEAPWIRMLKAILVYLMSIVGGSIAFDYVPNKETCGLVGASAGVFGLSGMCIVEALICIVSIISKSSFPKNVIEYNDTLMRFILAGVKLFLSLILVGIDLYYNLPSSSSHLVDTDLAKTHHLDTLYVHIGGLSSGILIILLNEILTYILNRKNQ